MKRIILMLLLCVFTLALFSCADGGDAFPVMVSFGEGVTVEGENPVMAHRGDNISFHITLSDGYIFHSVSDGIFDVERGILTLKNVKRRTNVSFYAEAVDYDTTKETVYFFRGADGDYDDVDSLTVKLGASVSVISENEDKLFLGWSFGKSLEGGGTIASTERKYKFRVTPELLRGNVLYVYANYSESSSAIFYYNVNGGEVNSATKNMQDNDYYSVKKNDTGITVSLKDRYISYAASASTFYDDGTFTRDGYILREYNTSPDGSGESYSLGSKFYADSENGIPTLYCIWEKETPASEFTVRELSYPCPVRLDYATNWHENGVIIEKYLGDSARVAIPEKIGGKYVIAVAEGAFSGKNLDTLTLSRHIQKIEDGAFSDCTALSTVYYPDGIYQISDAAFGAATLASLKHLYVNASTAPRFSNTGDGAFAVKLSRLLETRKNKQIIVISGSSSLEGLATEYLEALLSGEYSVVNFGTTRTTHGLIYLEAMQYYASSEDIVIYAPENSAYMMGEREMYWKTLRDLEPLNNFFRYIDISNYTGVFTAFSDFNQNYKYKRAERRYEEFADCATSDKNGDYQREGRDSFDYPNYIDAYYVTMNERFKSKDEGQWNKVDEQEKNKDYTDLSNPTWQSINEASYVSMMNHAIRAAKSSGASVIFSFCPVDYNALVPEAKSTAHLAEYDELIKSLYEFDYVLGKSENYVFHHKYFFDCAFHTNDYGRVYRTYTLYLDLAARLGIESPKALRAEGTDFAGCMFEKGTANEPEFKISFGG